MLGEARELEDSSVVRRGSPDEDDQPDSREISDGAAPGQLGAPGTPANGYPSNLRLHHAARLPRWHDYTAFILTGGGARGALQVGALRALLEHGIRPDVVIGVSIG